MSKLSSTPSFNARFPDDCDTGRLPLQYTSLKDVIPVSPKNAPAAAPTIDAFDLDNIAIRNDLVKHAASAYVLAATTRMIVSSSCGEDGHDHEQHYCWIGEVWEKMRGICVRDVTLRQVFMFCYYKVVGVARVVSVWRLMLKCLCVFLIVSSFWTVSCMG